MIVCTLKDVLKRKRWTRYQLAKKSRVSYPALSRMFHGDTRSYDRDVLDRLCAVLRCQPADLLVWKKPMRFPRQK